MGDQFLVNSVESLANYHRYIDELFEKHKYITFGYTTGSQRTPKQQAALEVYCRLLAEALNTAGLDMVQVLRSGAEIPWSQSTVKDRLWRPLMEATIGKTSTTEALRSEYNEVYEVLTRHLGQKFGLPHVPWPVKEDKK